MASWLNSGVAEQLWRALLTPADPDSADSIDPEFIETFAPFLDELIGKSYLRMEIEGLDGVPAGPALVVGNHNAGITFIEPIALGAHWYVRRGTGDLIQWLVHDAMLMFPGLSTFLVKSGCVRASHALSDEVLARGRKLAVFPGGNLEAFRPYRKRHEVVFGGRKGFLKVALRHSLPIVPVVFVGGHESFFVLWDGKPLARPLGLKRFLRADTCPIFLGLPWGIAVGPTFHLHLPTKSNVRLLDPIETQAYGPQGADDPGLLDELYTRVTGAMQAAMQELGERRRFPVIG